MTAVLQRTQLLHGSSRGVTAQKEGAVQGLHQGAFAAFVGPCDQGQTWMEVQLQLGMAANAVQTAAEVSRRHLLVTRAEGINGEAMQFT